jgi:opacity protein-like surface antigen
VFAFTVGVGGSFRIVGNLTLDVEATLYSGIADYGTYFLDFVDLYSVGLGAGLRYRF